MNTRIRQEFNHINHVMLPLVEHCLLMDFTVLIRITSLSNKAAILCVVYERISPKVTTVDFPFATSKTTI